MNPTNIETDKLIDKRRPETRVSELRREKMNALKPGERKVSDTNQADPLNPAIKK